MWVREVEGIPTITHTFYKKKVESRFTILIRSAISTGTKMSTSFQEGINRLSHMSPGLSWHEKVAVMNEKLLFST